MIYLMLVFGLTGCYKVQDSDDLRLGNYQADFNEIYRDLDLPDRLLSLDDVIKIALENNLDSRIKQREIEIQHEMATRERLSMIPSLFVNGSYSTRNQNTGSSSQSLTLTPPAPPSISSDKESRRFDTTLTWNLLDFGLSYYKARQEQDKVRMMAFDHERLQNQIILDVTRLYWKTIIAKQGLQKSASIIQKSKDQLSSLTSRMGEKDVDKIKGLEEQNRLLDIQVRVQKYPRDYYQAKAELTAMMGMAPGKEFSLVMPAMEPALLDIGNIEDLEELALKSRPELKSSDLEERIMAGEVKAAVLQMIPGIELTSGFNHDTNRFLVHHNWLVAGAKISWDLFNIPKGLRHRNVAEKQQELAVQNRIIVAVGVITQVNLAYMSYHESVKEYNLAKRLNGIHHNIVDSASKANEGGSVSETKLLNYESDAFFAEIEAWNKYAAVMGDLELLNSALGHSQKFRTN